jgi:N-acetyltransferase 10
MKKEKVFFFSSTYLPSIDLHLFVHTHTHVPPSHPRIPSLFVRCNACLVLDDELNILPISGAAGGGGGGGGALSNVVDASCSDGEVLAAQEASQHEAKELNSLVKSLADAQPAGALVGVCKTMDQVRKNVEKRDERDELETSYHMIA